MSSRQAVRMMRKQKESIFRYLTQSWSEERKMTGLVIALTFDIVIAYPLASVVGSSVAIRLTNDLVMAAVLLLGLFALTRHKITRMVLGGIILIAISIRSARFVLGAHWLLGWDSLLALVAVIAFVSFTMRYAYKEGPVTSQRIQAAVAAYLLITMAFALGYILISFRIPGAFRFPDKPPKIGDPRFGYIFHYFSIMTITTLGYGDIVPLHPFSRTLATIEALVGQLYPAILLARLVSLSIVDGRRSDKQKDD
jgi:voltage-gated potassium channel Kch